MKGNTMEQIHVHLNNGMEFTVSAMIDPDKHTYSFIKEFLTNDIGKQIGADPSTIPEITGISFEPKFNS